MNRTSCFLILIFAACSWAQAPSGRQLGLAGAQDLLEYSSDVVHGGAAVLARQQTQQLWIDLPRFSAGARNNSFSVNFWNDQFSKDRYLTSADKREIMDRISENGLTISGLASVPLAGAVYRKIALQFSEEYALHVNADRELFELALYGNQLNRGYTLEDFGGEQYALLDAGVALGYEFKQEAIKGLYGGIGFHFYLGQHLDKVTDAFGELSSTDSLLTGYGAVQRVRSNRGDGIGFDLSLLGEINERWSVGVGARQIGGGLTWVVDEATLDAFEVDSAGVIVDSLDDEDYVSRAFRSSSNSVSGGSIETQLPTILEASGRHVLTPRALLLATVRVRLQESAQGKPGGEIALGGEHKIAEMFLIRGGFGSGGPFGTRFSLGGGLRTGHYDLDIGCAWHDGLFASTKGLSIGFGHSIHW
ncbi:MAG: hypothetical protein H6506_04195 [Calditrichaeota bacterium]|nr:hypothetical protein [Calditrichota bacterium]MCB9366039.1 hypothetical protein [Calditrichota bacterium]MCB9391835.1 hypothetical protein [Calditrichota bacterium]